MAGLGLCEAKPSQRLASVLVWGEASPAWLQACWSGPRRKANPTSKWAYYKWAGPYAGKAKLAKACCRRASAMTEPSKHRVCWYWAGLCGNEPSKDAYLLVGLGL